MCDEMRKGLRNGLRNCFVSLLCLALMLTPMAGVALAVEGTNEATQIASTEMVLSLAETGFTDAVMSGNGQCVVLVSSKDNLVPGVSGEYGHVYVYDRVAGQIELISKDSNGVAGNNDSRMPAITPDGRYVAFISDATNLDPDDLLYSSTNPEDYYYYRKPYFTDVFVHDRVTGRTEMVSWGINGDASFGNSTQRPSISDDGSLVAFHSAYLHKTTLDIPGHIWVRNRTSGETIPVDQYSLNGAVYSFDADYPVISANGTHVAFVWFYEGRVDDPEDDGYRVHVRILGGGLLLVSANTTGTASTDYGSLQYPDVSADGTLVAFESSATDLVNNDSNSENDIFIRDLGSKQTQLASVSEAGVQGNSTSMMPAISADGQFTTFLSSATNLVDADSNGYLVDAFVYDRLSGTMELVSIDSAWQQFNQSVRLVSISDDGQLVFFYLENGDAYIHQRGERVNLPVISPQHLEFGEVVTGHTKAFDITVTNNGSTDLTLTSAISGEGFTITAGELTSQTLLPADSITITVQFAPTTMGAAIGNVSITTDGTATEQTVTLGGTGISPEIEVSPTAIDFGNTPVGTSSSQTITISNTGTAPLKIGSLSVTGEGVSITSDPSGLELAAGTSCTANIELVPSAVGTVIGELIIPSDDQDEATLTLGLTGTGISPEIVVSTSTIDFGDTLVGTSASQTITITNTGTARLVLGKLSITGEGFNLTTDPSGQELLAGESRTVTVEFTPTAAGSVNGQITVSSNDPEQATLSVALTGTGIAPTADIDATVDINPGTFNMTSRGKNDINVTIQLPTGYDVNLIDTTTIVLTIDGMNVPILLDTALVTDSDFDGVWELTCKFDKNFVLAEVDPTADEVAITVSGELSTGQRFSGSDTVKVLNKLP